MEEIICLHPCPGFLRPFGSCIPKEKPKFPIHLRPVPYLVEQHCVAHREDLGLDDGWKQIPLMKQLETLI